MQNKLDYFDIVIYPNPTPTQNNIELKKWNRIQHPYKTTSMENDPK